MTYDVQRPAILNSMDEMHDLIGPDKDSLLSLWTSKSTNTLIVSMLIYTYINITALLVALLGSAVFR